MFAIPNDPTNGGPESYGDPLTWRDQVDCASDEIFNAGRIARDDIDAERKLRIAAVDEAISRLQAALAMLAGGAR